MSSGHHKYTTMAFTAPSPTAVVAHTFDHSTLESEARESLSSRPAWLTEQGIHRETPEIHRETPSGAEVGKETTEAGITSTGGACVSPYPSLSLPLPPPQACARLTPSDPSLSLSETLSLCKQRTTYKSEVTGQPSLCPH